MVKTKRTSKLLAWIPALAVIGATVITASGLSLIPSATATNVQVDGTVAGGVLIAATTDAGCTAGLSLAGFASGFVQTATCQVTYAANQRSHVMYTDAAGDANSFFCGDNDVTAGFQVGTRSCVAATQRVDNVAADEQTIGANETGLALLAVGGDGGNTAGAQHITGPDPTPTAGESIWSPVDAGANELCTTTGANASATCDFRVGAQGQGGSQMAGDYQGNITLSVVPY